MSDLTAHNHAHRRLRAQAKKVGCFVVLVPDTSVRTGSVADRYEVVCKNTGKVRGELLAPVRQLTDGAVDEFFERTFQ